jgi:hypothetical protein
MPSQSLNRRNAMTQMSKPISLELNVLQDRDLKDDELDAISGGDVKAESQIQQTLSTMVSDVIKNFGGAMQAAARG